MYRCNFRSRVSRPNYRLHVLTSWLTYVYTLFGHSSQALWACMDWDAEGDASSCERTSRSSIHRSGCKHRTSAVALWFNSRRCSISFNPSIRLGSNFSVSSLQAVRQASLSTVRHSNSAVGMPQSFLFAFSVSLCSIRTTTTGVSAKSKSTVEGALWIVGLYNTVSVYTVGRNEFFLTYTAVNSTWSHQLAECGRLLSLLCFTWRGWLMVTIRRCSTKRPRWILFFD